MTRTDASRRFLAMVMFSFGAMLEMPACWGVLTRTFCSWSLENPRPFQMFSDGMEMRVKLLLRILKVLYSFCLLPEITGQEGNWELMRGAGFREQTEQLNDHSFPQQGKCQSRLNFEF